MDLKRVMLSVPGVPNGYASMDSTLYHDPYPFLEALREIFGKVDLDTFIWPQEFPHPWGEWTAKVPGMAIPLYYYSYLKLPQYREPIISAVSERIQVLSEDNNEIYLLSHSHGNRVSYDAMQTLSQEVLSKITWISQAPAFNNVLFGAVPTSVEAEDLKKVTEYLKDAYFYRIHSDTLSGEPDLENVYSFSPHWYEVGPVAHAMVRRREDIVEHFKMQIHLLERYNLRLSSE